MHLKGIESRLFHMNFMPEMFLSFCVWTFVLNFFKVIFQLSLLLFHVSVCKDQMSKVHFFCIEIYQNIYILSYEQLSFKEVIHFEWKEISQNDFFKILKNFV